MIGMISSFRHAKGVRKAVSVVAVLALVLALLPVVPAWASANLSVTPSSSNAGAEVDYTISATLSDPDVIPVGQVAGKNVVVTFPSGFEIKTAGIALPVTVTVDSTPHYAQIIPTVSADKLSATFVVPAALLPPSGNVTKFEVNGLRVKNAATAGTQTVKMTFEGANKTVQADVTLVAGVYSVTIDQPVANAQVAADSSVLFKGYVKDAAGNGVGGASVAVKQGATPVGAGTTLSNGYYEVSVTAPTTSGSVTYTVEASKSVDGVSTSAQASVTVSVVAGQPAKLDFSVAPSSLTKGERAKFTVQLKDANNNVATAGAGGVTVYLKAELTTAIDGSKLGGRFYDAESGGKEITSVTIAQGSSSADFWFEPVVDFSSNANTLTVSASAQGLTAVTKEYTSVSAPTAPNNVTVTITPLATDASGAPVAGWPLKVVATLNQPADQDYTVQVNLTSGGSAADWATWDTAANLSFGAVGAKKSADTTVIAKGKKELVFYVYTTAAAKGKTLTVEVKETSPTPVFTGTGSTAAAFTDDLTRDLDAGWNVLSTPLKLAGAGTMASLVGDADKIEIVYTFENGSFRQVDRNNEKLEPLKGYFVKMKQGLTVSYYLARSTMVEDTVPTKRQLAAGWNLLGVGTLDRTKYVEDILANVKDKYTAVVNPGAGNQATWSAVTPASARVEVRPGDAYWVYMAAPGEVTALAVPQLISP